MSDMNAISIREHGGPEVLELIRAPKPQPGPGQILIKTHTAGVNRPDCLQRLGNYPVPADASPLPGLEVSGTVAALGDGVNNWTANQRVCALVHGGGYAEYCIAESGHTLAVPETMDLREAGGAPETAFTVFYNLWQRCHLRAGETLLVHGGSSGIGSMAIQLAHAQGCRVLTTAGSRQKVDFCLQLGANRAINYKEEDFAEALANEEVDVVLDMIGGSYIQPNLKLLRRDGRYCFIAFLGGAKAEVSFIPILRNRLTLTGSTLRPQSIAEKAQIADALKEQVWPWIAQGQIKIPIHASFPLADASKAHSLMESSSHMGKIVLTI